jgi:hypothetical protein
MTFPAVRDPHLVSIWRGRLLIDAAHRLLALWASTCAEQVLGLIENACRDRPREAIDAARAWGRGEAKMMVTRAIAGQPMGAARALRGASRFVAFGSGQAACVAHIAERDLGRSRTRSRPRLLQRPAIRNAIPRVLSSHDRVSRSRPSCPRGPKLQEQHLLVRLR